MTRSPKILCIDGYNQFHRARSGFALGEHAVVFNFFRNLRALVEMHDPTQIFCVLEGSPVKRLKTLPTYKANRIVDPEKEPKKHAELVSFHRQKDIIVDMLKKYFPISVVHHPNFECDDVIYNLIKRSPRTTPWVVASNDSDFTQLLNEFDHVQVYNPMKKTYVEKPAYDYVAWKALRGDGSDNIPGIPGIGDKTAEKLAIDFANKGNMLIRTLITGDVSIDNAMLFEKNVDLIKFETWSDAEALEMTCSTPAKNWQEVSKKFEEFQFASLLKEKTWKKYVDTFDHLWEDNV